MPQQQTRRRVRSNRGPGLLTANLNGNSIPAWGPFVYKVAIVLTLIFVSISAITTMVVVGSAPNMLAVVTTLAALVTQVLVSICCLVLLKFVLEYLSRSARIEQKMNEPVVESFQ